MVQSKAPRILERRYDDIDFALRWLLKDVRYALALGKQFGVPLRTIEAAEAVFQCGRRARPRRRQLRGRRPRAWTAGPVPSTAIRRNCSGQHS